MMEFAGWEMPVQYRGIVQEHIAVRTRVGLFDVSHMGEIEIRGPRALAACQYLTVNDIGRLRDGQAQYSLLCLPSAGVVDDVVVHRFSSEHYLLCVNAANREGDLEWISANSLGADVFDRSDEFAQLALQGPLATKVLSPLTDAALEHIARLCFAKARVAGRDAIVAHTGYTGEDGWEIYCPAQDAEHIWDAVLSAGEPHGILPAGLGARNTLRLERALPLYGHELTRETSPLEAGLGWVVRFEKGDFLGRDALQRQKGEGPRRRLIGLITTDPGIPRQGYAILFEGKRVGGVTSGTRSPTLGEGIGLGYVETPHTSVGTELSVEIRGRPVRARVVSLPFYRPHRGS
jgi:aminomethyltransferase